MPILNTADLIAAGNAIIDRVYAGIQLVWSKVTPPVDPEPEPTPDPVAGSPNYFVGGYVVEDDNYRWHYFYESGDLTFVDVDGLGTAIAVDRLVVAGGGGGGVQFSAGGGGGGAGGYLTATQTTLSASQSVVVGAGGAKQTNGSDSALGAVTALGGGLGGSWTPGGGGGSGGGGSGVNAGGTATVGQGFDGGDGFSGTPGGGGGAGEVGSTDGARLGGDGLTWVDGVTRAGGGGGGHGTSGIAEYPGGDGGGGTGGSRAATTGSPGEANTGGGGGGVAGSQDVHGGSGIVAIRYPKPTFTFDPTDFSPNIWFDFSDESSVTASEGVYTAVLDKSPNSRDVSTIVGSPAVSTLAGRSAASFNGTTDYMLTALENPSPLWAPGFCVAFTVDPVDLNDRSFWIGTEVVGTFNVGQSVANTGSVRMYMTSGTRGESGAALEVGEPNLILVNVTGAGDWELWVNGQLRASGTNATMPTAGNDNMVIAKASIYLATGVVGEIVHTPTLTATGVGQLSEYLARKWGINYEDRTARSYATGGEVYDDGDYRYHVFNESGDLGFVDIDGPIEGAEYLVVAGGGGAQRNAGASGGGGAGGYLAAASVSLDGSQVVTVGAGGAGETNGSNSALGALATAIGGGYGGAGSVGTPASDGGSGGGGANDGANKQGGSGTVGQGYDGGGTTTADGTAAGAGGGGAGAAGSPASTSDNTGGNGGEGKAWVDGNTYAGGGGGGGIPPGSGGTGGGGDGSNVNGAATSGTANTGGGGGGSWSTGGTTGLGGSGVVIVRYPKAGRPRYLSEAADAWVAKDFDGTTLTARNNGWDFTRTAAGSRLFDDVGYYVETGPGISMNTAVNKVFLPRTGAEGFTAVLVHEMDQAADGEQFMMGHGTGSTNQGWSVSKTLSGEWKRADQRWAADGGDVGVFGSFDDQVTSEPFGVVTTIAAGRQETGEMFLYSPTGGRKVGPLRPGNSDAADRPFSINPYLGKFYGAAFFYRELSDAEIAEAAAELLEANTVPRSYLTGGTVKVEDGYRYHILRSDDTLVLNGDLPVEAEYLLVGGGGGGGSIDGSNRGGGGGGGGGFVTGVASLTANQAVTVGAGGAADSTGGSSSLGAITVDGGGGGGSAETLTGGDGGSGGGGGSRLGNEGIGGSATAGQGNDGGSAAAGGSPRAGAGGGGAGAAGTTPTETGTGSDGGDGAEWPVGSGQYWASGGGGGSVVGGQGGLGGGGAGSNNGVTPGDGLANTGSGGGGASYSATLAGGAGGSGICIVRYPDDATFPAPPTPTPTYLTGGVVTVVDGYRYHTFLESGDLGIVAGDDVWVVADTLTVAGGGGGGERNNTIQAGGGGGAGGMLTATAYSLGATTTITVGAGGAAATSTAGTDGSDSSLGAVSSATGGGGGGSKFAAAGSGGSGGGAGSDGTAGTGTAGQGNDGGNDDGAHTSGGGGGKGAAGAAGVSNVASGDGGSGEPWLDGAAYAGGGGGGSGTAAAPGSGGSGGGGDGGQREVVTATSGSANTGGGGGGGASNNGTAGAGGSGIVIVRYPDKEGMPPPIVNDALARFDFSATSSYRLTGTTVTSMDNLGQYDLGPLVATEAAGPDITAETLNGRPVAQFPNPAPAVDADALGVSGLLITELTGDQHILLLMKPVNATANHPAIELGTRTHLATNGETSRFVINPSGSTQSNAAADASYDEWHLVEAKYSTAEQNIFVSVDGGDFSAGSALITGTVATPASFIMRPEGDSIAEAMVFDRLLTTVELFEIKTYLSEKWGIDPPPPLQQPYLVGGVVTDEVHDGTTYRVHTFNESGDLVYVPGDTGEPVDVDYLVVAGGGGGGNRKAGGGGAGGYVPVASYSLGATQTVTVGAGGAISTVGSNSSLGAISVADGGGRGGDITANGGAGGSGGGGGGDVESTGGSATVGQGNDGGVGRQDANNDPGGGGGGAGAVGQNAELTPDAGDGGAGLAWLDGVTRAGGGGGGVDSFAGKIGVGGTGGGGSGGSSNTAGVTPTAGAANSGGGGGGGGESNQTTGVGGSGVVKVRYPLTDTMPAVGFEFLQAESDVSNAVTYTFSSQSFGAADTSRQVIVAVSQRSLGNAVPLTVVVGGVEASLIVTQEAVDNAAVNRVSMYSAHVPAGTIGDVVVTMNAESLRCSVSLYRVTGVGVPNDTDRASLHEGTDLPLSVSATAGGFVIAVAASPISGSWSWSGGLTNDYDEVIEGFLTASSASYASVDGGTVGITASASALSTDPVAIAVAW